MLKERFFKKELIDSLQIDEKDLYKNLAEFELLNKLFGSNRVLFNGLNKIENKYEFGATKKKIVIADIGCGAGDGLRFIQLWAQKRNISCELIGIDVNPAIIKYAQKASLGIPNLQFFVLDANDASFQGMNFDIVCLNNVFHHFQNDEASNFLIKLKKETHFAILINDLKRHIIPYYTILGLTKVFNFSNLAKHDGPLSILKAFSHNELSAIFEKTKIHDFEVSDFFPFRLQAIGWCQE
jgi:SAM-dependent methyltransferase